MGLAFFVPQVLDRMWTGSGFCSTGRPVMAD